jgi:hypothetical protein
MGQSAAPAEENADTMRKTTSATADQQEVFICLRSLIASGEPFPVHIYSFIITLPRGR